MSDQSRCPEFIVTVEGEIHGEDTPENREIVRRIHACVNACQGISTEELENGLLDDLRGVLAMVLPVLKQQELNQKLATVEQMVSR